MNTNYVRLTLFPYSFIGEAKRWLNIEAAISNTTWDDLAKRLLIRFFPLGKTARLHRKIVSFKQKPDENLYHA